MTMTLYIRTRKKAVKINFKRLLLSICILILSIQFMANLGGFLWQKIIQEPEPISYEYYVISDGQKMWNIAQDFCPQNMDIRKYIDIVEDYNGIRAGYIYAGQSIYLPIFEG